MEDCNAIIIDIHSKRNSRLIRSTDDVVIEQDYMERLLNVFECGDGYWNRLWWKSIRKIDLASYNTKGFACAMIGLLNSYKMFREEKYLEKAKKMADNIFCTSRKMENGSCL